MDYRIEEIRFGDDPKIYFKPFKSGKYGLMRSIQNCGDAFVKPTRML